MDFGSLPDLANHFTVAAQSIMPIAHHCMDAVMNAGANFWAGLTDPNAMSAGEKGFQLLKIAVATLGLSASIGTANIEAGLACAVTDCEAVRDIAKAGAHVRHLAP